MPDTLTAARVAWLRLVAISILPLAFFLAAGFGGLDFGRHWDDEPMLEQPRRALTAPITLLPGRYNYPSVSFWLSLSGLVPEALRDTRLRQIRPDGSALAAFTATDRYRLRVRGLFLVTTSLVVIWIAGLSLRLGGGHAEALLACAMAALSWEVGYHARWIAPDGPLMMLGALATFAAAASLQSTGARRARWLALATVATGCACGTKYSGLPLVVPLAIAAWHLPCPPNMDERPTRRRRVCMVLAAAVGVYLITTPGTLLQPTLFLHDLAFEVWHYSHLGHGGYTVTRGLVHFWRMAGYLSTVLLSPNAPLALILALFALLGVRSLWRQSRPLATLILSLPAIYLLYFASQRVMLVRNLLMMVPVLTVLSARGVAFSVSRVTSRFARAAGLAVVVGALAFNAAYDVWTVHSIRARNEGAALREFAAWVGTQPAGSVAVSPRVEEQLAGAGLPAPAPGAPQQIEYVAFSLYEAPRYLVEANRRGTFSPVFGPRDVNLDYYPTWSGDDRVLVMLRTRAGGVPWRTP